VKDAADLLLLQAANALCEVAEVAVGHVRGHAGLEGNEICDAAAKKALPSAANQPLQYTYEAAKSRVRSITAASRRKKLLADVRANPDGRLAQAATLTDNFERNSTVRLDLPRRSAIIVNQLETGCCPLVFPEPTWSSTKKRRCQFCGGSGSALHFLLTCSDLAETRRKTLGLHPDLKQLQRDPLPIVNFVRAVAGNLHTPDYPPDPAIPVSQGQISEERAAHGNEDELPPVDWGLLQGGIFDSD
jgi:hypothetical protein